MSEEKQLPVQQVSESAMSTLILKGDISKLSDTEKVQYYHSVCSRLGIDPLTKPFDYLVLNGKQVLYLNKSGAEQLNRVHKVSMSITETKKLDDIYCVIARAEVLDSSDPNLAPRARSVDSTGVVNIKGLSGDALCNAMMKAETKAKRRATISLLGLAMLDETEVETIPGAVQHKVEIVDAPAVTDDDWQTVEKIAKQNRWPLPYVEKWRDSARKSGKGEEEIYERALERFGQPNEEPAKND